MEDSRNSRPDAKFGNTAKPSHNDSWKRTWLVIGLATTLLVATLGLWVAPIYLDQEKIWYEVSVRLPSAHPLWRGVPRQRYLDAQQPILRASYETGLDPDLLRAVILVESSYNPKAVSPKGAQGLMQLMPATAQELGVRNSFDPYENTAGGARYLKYLLNTFDSDLQQALAGYNAGPGAVARHGGVPPYAETLNYVQKVLEIYASLQQRSIESLLEDYNSQGVSS